MEMNLSQQLNTCFFVMDFLEDKYPGSSEGPRILVDNKYLQIDGIFWNCNLLHK